MYKKALLALMVAISLLGSQASVVVAESNFAVGDKWAFGKEIDLMEEISSDISELEGNITELMNSEEAEMVKNASGLELKSFDLANKAVLGFYYTGEVVDDFKHLQESAISTLSTAALQEVDRIQQQLVDQIADLEAAVTSRDQQIDELRSELSDIVSRLESLEA